MASEACGRHMQCSVLCAKSVVPIGEAEGKSVVPIGEAEGKSSPHTENVRFQRVCCRVWSPGSSAQENMLSMQLK
eukprot:CAMPEP_0196652820 /NCGR_PEP_ID=MMETSP1086-20130531/2267_1 /TAXON_ID=77921 /ORGANISM="Cyanoptyche  gloeocystis , Strain SAG4.97" /LENGTH=74 /DNA_ID=CAMNT_0041983609 /DNA_START=67 /DNA_END=291 /DNA_ORIENTATION=+